MCKYIQVVFENFRSFQCSVISTNNETAFQDPKKNVLLRFLNEYLLDEW